MSGLAESLMWVISMGICFFPSIILFLNWVVLFRIYYGLCGRINTCFRVAGVILTKCFQLVFFVNCIFSSQRKSKSGVTELFGLWYLETGIEIHGLLQKAVFFFPSL